MQLRAEQQNIEQDAPKYARYFCPSTALKAAGKSRGQSLLKRSRNVEGHGPGWTSNSRVRMEHTESIKGNPTTSKWRSNPPIQSSKFPVKVQHNQLQKLGLRTGYMCTVTVNIIITRMVTCTHVCFQCFSATPKRDSVKSTLCLGLTYDSGTTRS
ncbi:hypothetical protein BDN72DRAFT_863348 [Pluteus cervinus]|uniref:Uncharacterized protein n=1 Tax=Pluteus cervinus TaxID=181527 RepID=A0ACD3A7X9_9AGAR|nr:hypothetical protein BDN72DRAFT_863348 [Pluteus cervinus]